VEDSCGALAALGRLYGYRHDGFWKPADTFKERAELDAGYHRGDRPWMVWERAAS
jgi:glucose-1-phosphate cytidylyltransferase